MKRSSWIILASAALLHLGLLVGWRWQQPLVPYFFDATVLSGGRGLDFYAIYQAGYNARHGRDIYEGDPARIAVVVPYFTPYRYPPPAAYTVGAALSLLPSLTAYKVWVVMIEATLLACVAVTAWLTRGQPEMFARLAAMWLAFTPFYLELFMGQFSTIQGALIFGLLIAAERQAAGGRAFAGLWVASLLWKINTALFAPVLLRLRQWRLLGLAAAAALLTTLPYFLVFPAHLGDFVANNFLGRVAGHELGNLGARQLLFAALAAAGAEASLQALAQGAWVGAVLAGAAVLTWLTRPVRPARLLALWVVVFFLVSPQVWEHHYVMLLPVLVWAYWRQPHWMVALAWLLLALPTPFGFIGLQPVIATNHDLRAFALQPAWQPLLQHASKVLPTLLLALYCVWQAAADAAWPRRWHSPALGAKPAE